MPTVHFLGKVLPSAIRISLTSIPTVHWLAQELGITLHFNIRVVESAVDVAVDVDPFRPEDVGVLYNRAFDLVRACVDTVSFATGTGFTVYLETLVDPAGGQSSLVPQKPNLGLLCTFFRFPTLTMDDQREFEKALSTVMAEPVLFMSLNDLIQSQTLPHHGPVNCGRILDGLRKLVAPVETPKAGWPILQAIVNTDDRYMRFVSDLATNPRHGDRSYITGAETTESQRRTWIIMNRFLEYRKRGNRALPLAEFPMLLG